MEIVVDFQSFHAILCLDSGSPLTSRSGAPLTRPVNQCYPLLFAATKATSRRGTCSTCLVAAGTDSELGVNPLCRDRLATLMNTGEATVAAA